MVVLYGQLYVLFENINNTSASKISYDRDKCHWTGIEKEWTRGKTAFVHKIKFWLKYACRLIFSSEPLQKVNITGLFRSTLTCE